MPGRTPSCKGVVASYTQRGIHTDGHTHGGSYTQRLIHTEGHTHRGSYTRRVIHTEGHTHRRSYTQRVTYTEGHTHGGSYFCDKDPDLAWPNSRNTVARDARMGRNLASRKCSLVTKTAYDFGRIQPSKILERPWSQLEK